MLDDEQRTFPFDFVMDTGALIISVWHGLTLLDYHNALMRTPFGSADTPIIQAG